MKNMKNRAELAKEINAASSYVVAVCDGNHTANVVIEGKAVEVFAATIAIATEVVKRLATLAGEQVAMQSAENIAKAMVEAIQAKTKESEGGREDENDHH
jgi:hypothetical protein